MRWLVVVCALAVFATFNSTSCHGEGTRLRTCFWNVESGGSSSNVNANRIKNESGVDIWGLSEVKNASDAVKYQVAAAVGENADFESVLGTTGGQDRLLIIYNSDKLELLGSQQLHNINIGGSVRSPLVAHFKLIGNGKAFFFMVNHLYRGNNAARHLQATRINDWAESQDLPVIQGGDMNFDWHYLNGATDHDRGYENMVADGVFLWIEPQAPLVPTNSSSHKSVLDFVFVSGEAQTWPAVSRILVTPGDFPDGALRSDHRPVDCVFTIPLESEPNSFREPIRITMAQANSDPLALATDDYENTSPEVDMDSLKRSLDRISERLEELTDAIRRLDK